MLLCIEKMDKCQINIPLPQMKFILFNSSRQTHCKEITKANAQRVQKFMKSKKYHCEVIWS